MTEHSSKNDPQNFTPWRCRIRGHKTEDFVMDITEGVKRYLLTCSCGRVWTGTPVKRKTRYRWA